MTDDRQHINVLDREDVPATPDARTRRQLAGAVRRDCLQSKYAQSTERLSQYLLLFQILESNRTNANLAIATTAISRSTDSAAPK